MADIFNDLLTQDVTHDESDGLQTSGVPSAFDDNDDDDILLSSVAGIITTLSGMGATGTAIGAARNQVLTMVEGTDPQLKFRLADGPDADGSDELLDIEATTLTTTDGGDIITLVRIDDYTIFGYADYDGADERVAFALILEPIAPTESTPGGANILIIQYEALYNLDPNDPDDALDLTDLVYVDAIEDVAFDDFSTAAAGQNLWNSVTDTTTGIQLLFTGLRFGTDTVNTSDFGIGSNSQTIKIGDGIVVGFVRGQTPATETDSNTFTTMDFTERVEGPSGGFGIIQTGGNNNNRVGAEVWAYDSDELGADIASGDFGTNTKTVTITAVQVYNGDTLVGSWTRADGIIFSADAGLSYSPTPTLPGEENSDDGVIIQGLLVGYRVEFDVGIIDSDDTGVLDRFSVENVSAGGKANDTFDLGDIRLGGQFGDSVEVGSSIRFEDDGPIAPAAYGPDLMVLDESAVGTDTADGVAPLGRATVSSDFSDNFGTPSYGTDGAGSLSYDLMLTGSDVASGLYALDAADKAAAGVDGDGIGQGAEILLNKVGSSIVGAVGGVTYFTISVDNDPLSGTFGYVTFSQSNNLWHANTGNHDDAETLTLAAANLLRLVQTVTDADGDSDSVALNLGTGVFSIQDDGPVAPSASGADLMVLDESAVGTDTADGVAPLGRATVSSDFSDNFGTPSYGTDGAGSLSYDLMLTGSDVASGLYALDAADKAAAGVDGDGIGQGAQILLNKVGSSIVGAVGGVTYFTISVDNDPLSGTFGYVTFSQSNNLWHANTGNHDDAETLTLAAANLLRLVQTVTDADGDSDSVAINLGTGVFSIQDDGPLSLQAVDGEIENKVGETATYALDDGNPASFTANYGTDGAGALILTGLNDTGPWSDGDALRDVGGNILYSNKQQVSLTGFGTNVLTAYVGADPLAVGAKVFTMTLNAAGTWTMEMFARIDDGSFDFDNFATAKAGNFTWLGVAGDEYPDKDLLVTGGVPNLTEVNNDSDDLAANNQWIDPEDPDDPSAVGEFLRLDLVNLGVAANVGGSDVNAIGNQPLVHYDANNVGFIIMQTLAGRPVDVRITAYDVADDIDGSDGTSVIDDLTTGVTDQIGAVTVITNASIDPDGITYLRAAAIADGNMLVSKEGGVIRVVWDSDIADGIEQDYVTVRDLEGAVSSKAEQRDQVFVATADGFNRMEIMNDEPDGSNDAFAIGGIQVGAVGVETDLAFNGEIIDADGDSAAIELIGVTLLPESFV